jgi:hypothetical protein
VTITYAQDGAHLSSDVAYRSRSSPDAPLSHVCGTERSDAPGQFVWRGDGWLCWCTSRWGVRGLGEREGVRWCVISESGPRAEWGWS